MNVFVLVSKFDSLILANVENTFPLNSLDLTQHFSMTLLRV